jgi:hypothetical protein
MFIYVNKYKYTSVIICILPNSFQGVSKGIFFLGNQYQKEYVFLMILATGLFVNTFTKRLPVFLIPINGSFFSGNFGGIFLTFGIFVGGLLLCKQSEIQKNNSITRTINLSWLNILE